MISSSKSLSACSDDIESRGQRDEVSAKNGQGRSTIDWDGYTKSGNKAASTWLICLFVALGLSVQPASLSTTVTEKAVIRSLLEDASFASPEFVPSSYASQMQRNVMEILEKNPESSQSSLEASDDTIESLLEDASFASPEFVP